MRKIAFSARRVFVLSIIAFCFTANLTADAQDPSAEPNVVSLRDGTPVRVQFSNSISSADARPGDKITLKVVQDVTLNGRAVMPKQALVYATVLTAEPGSSHHKDGQLVLHIDYAQLADGETIPLRTTKNLSATGAPAEAALLTASIPVPTNESQLVQRRGKDFEFLEGTEIALFVDGDAPLNLARFGDSNGKASAEGELTRLEMNSSPGPAEVDVDGKYISDTPAIIGLSPGKHIVTVRMAGYQSWQRDVTADGGGTIKRNVRLSQDGVNGSVIPQCTSSLACSDSPGAAAEAYKQKKDQRAEEYK